MTTSPDTTPSPDNPFAATDVGEIYKRGRPYHHPLPDGFEVVGTDLFEDPITMTRAEIRDWIYTSSESLFGDSPLEIQFLGTITALRRLP